jgi:hypothetical protein
MDKLRIIVGTIVGAVLPIFVGAVLTLAVWWFWGYWDEFIFYSSVGTFVPIFCLIGASVGAIDGLQKGKQEKIFACTSPEERLEICKALYEIRNILNTRIVPWLRASSNPASAEYLKKLNDDLSELDWITKEK